MREPENSQLEFSLLGPLEVRSGGTPLDAGPPQRRVLLIRLLVEGGRTVSTDRLRKDLWGWHDSPGTVSSLHAHISRLRALLEPSRAHRRQGNVLVTEPTGYALRVRPRTLDTVRFQEGVDEAQQLMEAGDVDAAYDRAEEALGRWRGTPYAEAADYPFAEREILHLEETRLRVRQVRTSALLSLHRFDRALSGARELTTAHPMDETAWVLMMRALYLSGRPAEALYGYQTIRARLNEEGLEPGPALRATQLAILRHDIDRIAPAPRQRVVLSDPGPRETASGRRPRLPGRSAELSQLARVLDVARTGRAAWALVSGELGVGKTGLVEELAAHADGLGVRTVWTRGSAEPDAGQEAVPFRTAAGMLRQLLPERPLSPDSLLPSTTGGPGGHALGRFRAFDRIAHDLLHALAGRPTLCVIDDMQHVDADSRALLTFLAVHLRTAPLALICVSRDFGQADLDGFSLTVMREGGCHLRLVPFTAQESREVVRRWCASSPTSRVEAADDIDLMARALHRRSAGNPLWLTELLRSAENDGDWAGERIPRVAHRILTSIARGLRQPLRSFLETAAVIGEPVDIPLSAGVLGCSAEAVLDLIEETLTAGLLVWRDGQGHGEAGYRFTWPLFKEVVLSEMSPLRKQRLRTASAARRLADPPGGRVRAPQRRAPRSVPEAAARRTPAPALAEQR
ncbi:BTAD domain-containing putative transcriptional regulator [Streptomyces spongiae]|uniref:BTAD domain-containing putative transcriptional regulator n=1 Tax=Streptomyces spongiae TaxID=565072 RepID=UPI00128B731F|nr:BTAD domain-containing putative transcriptional regulator [Streptomyces spongiae]